MVVLSVSLRGRHCVIIGGGQIAERRVAMLLEEGAKVTVISPEISEKIKEWEDEGKIDVRREAYDTTLLPQAAFVFATTDVEAVNAACAADGRAIGAFVHRADKKEDCDFTIPALLSMGDLRFTVSSNGVSPRINRLIKGDLEARYEPLVAVLPAIRQWRETVKESLATAEEREAFWRAHFGPEELAMILDGNWQLVEEKLNNAISSTGT